ncbi:hypothetical protein EMIT0111MI5_160050 [Burkholderia sp. IT-111MI5]
MTGEGQKRKRAFPEESPFKVARLAGFEPTTPWFVAKYSIQLSYSRTQNGTASTVGTFCDGKAPKKVARLAGFEPTTPWFVAKYSIQLSYSRTQNKTLLLRTERAFGLEGPRKGGAAGRIRTHDPLVRSQVLYPTELQPHAEAKL